MDNTTLKGAIVIGFIASTFAFYNIYHPPTTNAFIAANRGDYVLSVQLLESDANKGNLNANTTLANYYKLGLGVPKDASKAVALYAISAHGGDQSGMINLALMYRDGLGIEQNNELAYAWLNLAYLSKNPVAQLYMSEMLATQQISFHDVADIKRKYTSLKNMPSTVPENQQ